MSTSAFVAVSVVAALIVLSSANVSQLPVRALIEPYSPSPDISHLFSTAAAGPDQIHLNLGNGPTEMWVSWATYVDGDSGVLYGSSTKTFRDCKAQGSLSSYDWFGNYTSPNLYTAVMGGSKQPSDCVLRPSTTYFYTIVDGAGRLSTLYNFTTLAPVGTSDYWMLSVVGDLGQTSDSANTIKHISQDNLANLILHVGDLSYADCEQPRWDSYARLTESVAALRPWMVTPGNHEMEVYNYCAYYPGCCLNKDSVPFIAYESRYRMPSNSSSSSLYYSFNANNMHVVALNSYQLDFNGNAAQDLWLRADLAAVDRKLTPWLVVLMHNPWYNTNKAHQNEQETIITRNDWESLFYEHKVDIVFDGHVHAYERSLPVYLNLTNANGPTYINIGDGGNREGAELNWLETAAWSAFHESTFGHGTLELFNSTTARWIWHRNTEKDFRVGDYVYLTQQYSRTANYVDELRAQLLEHNTVA